MGKWLPRDNAVATGPVLSACRYLETRSSEGGVLDDTIPWLATNCRARLHVHITQILEQARLQC